MSASRDRGEFRSRLSLQARRHDFQTRVRLNALLPKKKPRESAGLFAFNRVPHSLGFTRCRIFSRTPDIALRETDDRVEFLQRKPLLGHGLGHRVIGFADDALLLIAAKPRSAFPRSSACTSVTRCNALAVASSFWSGIAAVGLPHGRRLCLRSRERNGREPCAGQDRAGEQ